MSEQRSAQPYNPIQHGFLTGSVAACVIWVCTTLIILSTVFLPIWLTLITGFCLGLGGGIWLGVQGGMLHHHRGMLRADEYVAARRRLR